MESEQYDVSPKMKKLFFEKQKQRAAAKEYYMKYIYNPYRPAGDTVPFDSSLQRFSAMSSYHIDYFKPRGKTALKYMLFLCPIVFTFFIMRHDRRKKENLIRSGLIKYEDRDKKFYY